MKRIMIAMDFTIASEMASQYGKSLSRHFGTEIDIVHAFGPSDDFAVTEPQMGFASESRKQRCIEKLEKIRAEFSRIGLKAEIASLESAQPAAALLKWAADRQADLIITGTESKMGLGGVRLGSIEEQLIRGARCPVLAVGANSHIHGGDPASFRNVVYATDLFPEARRAFAYALMFSRNSAAHLYVMHAIEGHEPLAAGGELLDQSFRTELRGLFLESPYEGFEPEVIVVEGKAAEVIPSICERVQADLLVLVARRTTALLTHIHRRLAPRLLQHVNCPILTVS